MRNALSAISALAASLFLVTPALAQPAMSAGHALRDSGEAYSVSGKAEAKVAFVDDAWWAVLSSAHGMDLLRLQGTEWLEETVGSPHLTNDPNMRADVLFTGSELLVLGTNGSAIELWDFQYVRPGFRLRPGFPVTVASGSGAVATDVATVAMDSTERLWVAYRAGTSGFVKASAGVGPSGWLTWKAPISFGYLGNGVAENASNNAVVAFTDAEGPKIGVVWADQSAPPENAYRFLWRRDSATTFTLSDWSGPEVAYTNGSELVANDQLSLVAFSGNVYVAAKTDTTPTASSTGMDRFVLLVRDPGGNWSKTTMQTIQGAGDPSTRPVIALDGEHGFLLAFWHDVGIVGKVVSLETLAFGSAQVQTFIEPSSLTTWDVQTTHQVLGSQTGLVIVADDNETGWQYWNAFSLGTPEAGNPVSTLSSIVVSPETATVASFGQVQLTAQGLDQNGQSFAITPRWVADGGSIDQTGLFTAGSVLGTFGVAATQSDTGHGTVFVTNGAPAIASLEIRPGPSTIAPGAQEQLTLVGIGPSGETVPIAAPVAWSVLDGVGAITTWGLYQAPSSENRAFIEASALNMTAFATVLIVPPPPATQAGPVTTTPTSSGNGSGSASGSGSGTHTASASGGGSGGGGGGGCVVARGRAGPGALLPFALLLVLYSGARRSRVFSTANR
jgi:hypothetical protein